MTILSDNTTPMIVLSDFQLIYSKQAHCVQGRKETGQEHIRHHDEDGAHVEELVKGRFLPESSWLASQSSETTW